jgi:hypothetical protein
MRSLFTDAFSIVALTSFVACSSTPGKPTDAGGDRGAPGDSVLLDRTNAGESAGSCECRKDRRNYCAYGANHPGCPVTAPRGYCDPDGDGDLSDGDWVRGYLDYLSFCHTTDALPVPSCSPGKADCDGNLDNGCEATLDNHGSCGATYRALILIDQRLYHVISTFIDQLQAKATSRRGFQIALQAVHGLDDLTFTKVKELINLQRGGRYPNLEGVLLVGNVKVPSFYKSNNDSNLVRLAPRYFEDLDGIFEKRYANDSIDPKCTPQNTPDCSTNGDFKVPAHDFDYVKKGPNPDPEIWVSWMPVGFQTNNSYARWGEQLIPYLRKVLRFYTSGVTTNGRFYLASNDRGEDFDHVWSTFSHEKVDFYGKPGPSGEVGAACLKGGQNLCYVRWPLESYASLAAFLGEYDKLRVGDGWQQSAIFLGHMNAATYPLVETNFRRENLPSGSEARAISKGGVIMVLSGNSVGAFEQPGGSATDFPAPIDENIMGSLLYGAGQTISALGDPFYRGHYGHFPTIYAALKINKSYLGQAHLDRMKKLFALAKDDPYLLREQGMEMLLGDPFVDCPN